MVVFLNSQKKSGFGDNPGLNFNFRDAGFAHFVEDVAGLTKECTLVAVDQDACFLTGHLVIGFEPIQELIEGDEFLVPSEGALGRDTNGD